MSLQSHRAEIKELIACLEKVAPKSCSKPESEMCSKCKARVLSEDSVQTRSYISELKKLLETNSLLNAKLETEVIEYLNSK
ncbi:MAG: hypothetical protein ACPGTP_08910 [Bacteroidia bacterium]